MNKTAAALKLEQFGIGTSNIKLADGSVMEVFEVVRIVPAKRLVCQGRWCGRAVYAKLFFGNDAAKYLARDRQGIELLLNANIETPPILFTGLSADGNVQMLILEAIPVAKNAELYWRDLELDASLRFKLACALVELLAEHHRAGLLQTDLYLKNFLIQETGSIETKDTKIFTLDGDGIRRLSFLFQKRQRLRNLATFFSKMDVLDERWISQLYALYCKRIGDQYKHSEEREVRHLTQKIRHQVASHYADNKVFRTCTDVRVTKGFKCFIAVASEFDAADFSSALLSDALADKNLNFKNGNTCTVGKSRLAKIDMVIKRYNIKNFWHGLNRAFRSSRAAKSWANAHRLIISGVLTPKPIALVEERLGCLRRRAYFLSEYVDAPDAAQFFEQHTNLQDKKVVAKNIATLFYKLYLLKISHGDCKATNIKIADGAAILIDLDGMKAHALHWLAAAWFKRQHVKDLQRLMKNWDDDAVVTALLKQALIQQYAEYDLYEEDDVLIRAKIV